MTLVAGSRTTSLSAQQRPRVLVVDDVAQNRELAVAYLEGLDCDVVPLTSGEAALAAVAQSPPDLVILDIMMPGIDGLTVCRQIKADPNTQFVPVMLVTAVTDTESRVIAYEVGADDYLTKPVTQIEIVARSSSLLRMKALHDRLDDAQRVIVALARAVQAKDLKTESHTERVASWARKLGEAVGMNPLDLGELYLGALVHDLGKIGVPDAILLKPGELDEVEEVVMRRHVIIGEAILRPLRSVAHLAPIVRSHHERIDGRGYPDGLKAGEIPLAARIVAICDSFDAMISDRPYRQALSRREAITRLRAGQGSQWDPALVDTFVEAVVGA